MSNGFGPTNIMSEILSSSTILPLYLYTEMLDTVYVFFPHQTKSINVDSVFLH